MTADWLISDAEPEDTTDASSEESTEQVRQNGASAYPDWINKAPSLIGKFVKRFGWLLGVYVTVIGAIFMGMGGIVKFALSRMVSSSEEFWSSVEVDMFGYPRFGESFTASPNPTSLADNPVSIIANVFLIIGGIIAILGLVLTFYLRKRSKR